MSKSPLIRETLLARELAATLVGCPESVHALMFGVKVSAKQLRELARQLDRLETATKLFFDESSDFKIEYEIDGLPAMAVVKEDSAHAALNLFKADYSRDKIISVYDCQEQKFVEFEDGLLND